MYTIALLNAIQSHSLSAEVFHLFTFFKNDIYILASAFQLLSSSNKVDFSRPEMSFSDNFLSCLQRVLNYVPINTLIVHFDLNIAI